MEEKRRCLIIDAKKKIDIFELVILSLIGGFVGLLVETIFVLLVDHTLVQRFIFVLPIAPVFTWATAIIYLLFYNVLPRLKNTFIVFLISLLVMGIFEIVTGEIFNLMGIEMWNYSKFDYNITDYTTIPICLGWGLLGIFYVMVAQPILLKILGKIPDKMRKKISVFLVVIYSVDLIFSIIRLYLDSEFIQTLVNPS